MSERSSDPIRVLHLITRFLDGGAETTTVNTLHALQESAHQLDLRLGVGAMYDSEKLQAVAALGVNTAVFRLIRHTDPLALSLSVGEVALYLRREEIEVLHTHSTEAGIVGRFAAAIADVPIVIHEIHGDPITPDRHWLLNGLIKHLERICATLSTVLIVKSTVIRDTYLKRGIGDPDHYELIYHGVDIDRFREAQPAVDLESDDRVVLTFVGRLTEGKGLFDLLSAIEGLDGAVKLLIVGDGPLRSELQQALNDRGLGGCVTLTGYREDIPSVLAAADVFVLPSYREGTPRAITEALASGTPVVSTDIAGIPEQVTDGETGYLISPGDEYALTDRLQRLVDDSDKREVMGTAAVSAVERFSLETAAHRYRDLYDRLLTEI